MKKNQGHKTKVQSSAEDKKKSDSFYNSGFEHITGKHICLKCNTVNSHAFKCCETESYYLGKIARTPKADASRAKWKDFYKYLIWSHKRYLSEHQEYANILKKYNLENEEKSA